MVVLRCGLKTILCVCCLVSHLIYMFTCALPNLFVINSLM